MPGAGWSGCREILVFRWYNSGMGKQLITESVEGEIGLVIDYQQGHARALDVLSGAMQLIQALDALDKALLSSIDSELEPVSILNDVQHSSLKMLLARALRHVPDDAIKSLDWKLWLGGLLVKGKYLLLQNLDADGPEIQRVLIELEPDYKAAPLLLGYDAPRVSDVHSALQQVSKARNLLVDERVMVQTEMGDIDLGEPVPKEPEPIAEAVRHVTTQGREFFKVRYPDMIANAQWSVVRGGRTVRVDIQHHAWLDAYHRREFPILPGDTLDCSFEESIGYDQNLNEVERKLSIIEVHDVVSPASPPKQPKLDL